MSNGSNEKVELVHSTYIQSEGRKKTLILAMVAAMLILISFTWMMGQEVNFDWNTLIQKLTTNMQEQPARLALPILPLIGSILAFFYMISARKHERLILDNTGIRYISPLPAIIRDLNPGWSLRWDLVREASIEMPKLGRGPNLVNLRLRSSRNTYNIKPFIWADPNTYKGPSTYQEVLKQAYGVNKPDIATIKKTIYESPLIQFISARNPQIKITDNFNINGNAKGNAIDFDLVKNTHSRNAIALVSVLFGYALIDFLIGPEDYPSRSFNLIQYLTIGGILIGIISGIWLSRNKIPPVICAVLAGLIGITFSMALYPGALRINMMTDSVGLQDHEYYVQFGLHTVKLKPSEPDLPEIDTFDVDPYWTQFEEGHVYTVKIRKGGLGFYQFDSSRITDDIRLFYKHMRSGNKR